MIGRNTKYDAKIIPEGAYFGYLNTEDSPGVWFKLRLESHHGVPRKVQNWLGMNKSVDDCPALLTTFLEHRGSGVGIHQKLSQKLGEKIGTDPVNLNQGLPNGLTPALIREALEETYEGLGLENFWTICKDWMDSP